MERCEEKREIHFSTEAIKYINVQKGGTTEEKE